MFCFRFYFCNYCSGRGIHPHKETTIMPFYIDGVEDKDRLLRSNACVRKTKENFCLGKPLNNAAKWEAYKAIVKGEYLRSPLEICPYFDLVFNCPLDAMHWLFGGIVKDFWRDVLMEAKHSRNDYYMSLNQVKDMFAHFNLKLKPPARWQRGCNYTIDNFKQLKMSDFMLPTECFPVSFYKCVSPYYRSVVLCIVVLIRYLMMPKWQRQYLSEEDKSTVKKLNKYMDRLLYNLHGYRRGCYSLNTHHLSHAFYLAEKLDGNFALYR